MELERLVLEKLRPDEEPHSSDVTRITEFAWYFNGLFGSEVHVLDKTFSELTKSQETLDKMKEKKTKNHLLDKRK